MNRDARAGNCARADDGFALGVSRVQRLPRVVVPQRFGDVVDQRVVLFGAGHPLRAHGQRFHRTDAFVGVRRDVVDGVKAKLFGQFVNLGPGDGQDVNAAGRGQLSDRPRWITAHKKEGVQRVVLEFFTGCVRLQKLGLDVLFGDAVRSQNRACVHDGARARLVERNALALELSEALDVGTLPHHEMKTFGIQIGDQAQVGNLGFALIRAGAGVGPVRHVRLRKAGLSSTALDGVDVGDRAVRCNRCGHQIRNRRLRNRVGDQATNGIVRTCGAAGVDAEKTLRGDAAGKGQSGRRRQGNEKRTFHDSTVPGQGVRHRIESAAHSSRF